LGSTLIFVSQNIFGKKLLPKEDGSAGSSSGGGGGGGGESPLKLDKLSLLLFSSGMAFLGMIPIWLYSDGSALFRAVFTASSEEASAINTTSLLYYFILNGSVHFLQNLLAFSILSLCSPVTYSIASLVKRIAVICLAIIWFGQSVNFVQSMGIALTFLGLWLYNGAKAKGDVEGGERRRGNIEKRGELVLPSTIGDARVLLMDERSQTPPTTRMHSVSGGETFGFRGHGVGVSVPIGPPPMSQRRASNPDGPGGRAQQTHVTL